MIFVLDGVDGRGGTGGIDWSNVSMDLDGRILATACRRSDKVGRFKDDALTLPTDIGSMIPTTRRLGVVSRFAALIGVVRAGEGSKSSSEEAAEDDTSPR